MTQEPVKVKVCGVTTAENAVACAEAGADWIGLNFHPASPRSITVGRGHEIVSALIEQGLAQPIALFVNCPFDDLGRIMSTLGKIDTVQLHGNEDLDYQLRCSNFHVVRVFKLRDEFSLASMKEFLHKSHQLGLAQHTILVDAHVPGQPGGTGQSIAMNLLDQLPPHPRLILAGGLTPENVAEYVARVHPWMVDVASGVESSPGVKDIARVKAFVAAAKSISRDTP